MPTTKAQRSAAAKKAAATRKRGATKGGARTDTVERTTELSGDVLKSLESGQRAAIDAVRKFVDTVDQALPGTGEEPSRRQEIVDAAMEMSDRLVHTQYEFLRNVVRGASHSLTGRERQVAGRTLVQAGRGATPTAPRLRGPSLSPSKE